MKTKRIAIVAFLVVCLFSILTNNALAFYNPQTGHWLSRDPSEERGGLNLYGFVRNNPVSQSDRNGQDENLPPVLHISSAGPDVTAALVQTLANVQHYWDSEPKRHCEACKKIEFPGALSSWDIVPLRQIGWGDLVLSRAGTGDWERTVQFRYGGGANKVYWASAVNYALWGKTHALCYAEFHQNKYNLQTALQYVKWRKDPPWPIGFGGSQSADAQAFTRYGYDGSSPEPVALPVGYFYPTTYRFADPKNITTLRYFQFNWDGLLDSHF